ncbi:hypothetical protein EV702DRAFT_492050 [Suillus placidus]|uniref:DUF6535 domain-containing protein n=1 Tax=Suillus placidus TaxID=48579 RepID=A0A9P7A537_9AGAM|nr:hypothetical protein EV702DRAFT_492050 [Suillus placidus]
MPELDDPMAPAQGQPESSEILLRQILNVLKQSIIAKKPPPSDDWNGFWDVYDQEAEEFDKSFVEKYASDLDNGLIFAGLFSAVSTAFLGSMLPNLYPAPSDTTNALLMMIYYQLNNTAFPGQVLSLPSWDGPHWITIWTQTLLYASLSASLLAALGAVLGKQWLRDYRDNTRGPRESRRIRRQLKVDGLETWHFEAVLRAIPALLQLSLLLFGTGLGGYLWIQQRTVAAVVIGTTCFGAFFYIVASISSYLYVSCPFTTPASALVYHSLSAIQSFIVIYVTRPLNWLVHTSMIGIQLDKWRSGWRPIALLCMAILMCLIYTIPLSLLGILVGALYFLTPPNDQPFVDVSRSVLWLCQTSLDPDAVFTAAKRIPDVTFPTDGLGSWAAWGKLFRLVQDGLKRPAPSPSVLIYAKALTSLYFTAYTSKNRFSPIFSHVGIEDVATLRVDMHCSHDATSLCFVLTVLQQWFDVVSGSWFIRMPEGKDIINTLGPDINLDDLPDDTLEWFLHPLLHGLCGAPLPWYKGENHRRHLFLQPLAIYIIRRLLPIDRPRPLPSRKIIARCLHVMIAILDWQSIDLEEIKTTDNSDNIETIFPRVLALLLRPDITAAIQDDAIPTVQHPEVTRSGIFSRIPRFIFSKSPRSRTFSANEVSHFRAILEPLARLASETEFRRHFEDNGVETWSTGVFQATLPKNIEDASTPALCLHACCTMDDLFKSVVVHSPTIWGPCQANADASVLLDYLDQAYPRPPQPDLNSDTALHLPPRRWLDPEFHNNIATAYALLMLSADDAIFTPETTTAVVPRIIFAMEHTESALHRHVGLKIAHVIKEPLVNITGDVREQLLPALRSATFGNIQSDTITPGDTSPDRFVYLERDLHYLELLFALANSEYWLLQLRQDCCHHMQRCISIAQAIHTPFHGEEDYRELSLRLVLIFARIACADNCVWPEWDVWFVARPDSQALLVKQAWEYPRILGECPDVVPLLIAFTNKMLSSLRDVTEKDLSMLPKDTVIAALGGISKQVQMVVDARMNVNEMQNALEVLGRGVVNSRDELLRHFGAQ